MFPLNRRNKHLFWHYFIGFSFLLVEYIFVKNHLTILVLLSMPLFLFIVAIYRFCAKEILIFPRYQSPYLKENDHSDPDGITYLIIALVLLFFAIFTIINLYILQ